MRAVFPGSFDPVTQGHLDVARRVAGMFDEVVMCVLTNPKKTGRLPLTDRLALLVDMTSDLGNVTVDSCASQLLVDYCRTAGVAVIVRGARKPGDVEDDMPMAQMNRHLSGIETLVVPTDPGQAYISSTLISATTDSGAGRASTSAVEQSTKPPTRPGRPREATLEDGCHCP